MPNVFMICLNSTLLHVIFRTAKAQTLAFWRMMSVLNTTLNKAYLFLWQPPMSQWRQSCHHDYVWCQPPMAQVLTTKLAPWQLFMSTSYVANGDWVGIIESLRFQVYISEYFWASVACGVSFHSSKIIVTMKWSLHIIFITLRGMMPKQRMNSVHYIHMHWLDSLWCGI